MVKKIFWWGLLFVMTPQVVWAQRTANYGRAMESLGVTINLFEVKDGTHLLRETYPYEEQHQATYLGTNTAKPAANLYAYLWPFSGSLSANVALYEHSKQEAILNHIDQVVIPGLQQYADFRHPFGYASYVKNAPTSDRFYDDNVWLGIDFTDLYLLTKKDSYLQEAKRIWTFVKSGMDDKLGGGIYWCEQRKESKNTCSNAPAVVYLLKLYEATREEAYLQEAKNLYAWTQKYLQDPADFLYWDNVKLDGKVDKAKYPYNTGQMIQAAALLYKLTKDKQYLDDAQASAAAGLTYFFEEKDREGNTYAFPILRKSDNWFIAVMLRGYIELAHQDGNLKYLQVFQANLDQAWSSMRDKQGLFGKDWKGKKEIDGKKWLLDQFAFVEMYASMAQE